ncbi:hypothetical protein EVA_21214, partial [gut metagenome]
SVANSGISGSSGGYISGMLTADYGRLPTAASGSSSTYEGDAVYFSNGTYYAFVGGHWYDGLVVGPFYAYLYDTASISTTTIGAALSCKPLAAA